MSREELEQRLQRAIEIRRTLRRATSRMMAFGEQLLRERFGDGWRSTSKTQAS